jgi:hypothetical protein
MMINIPAAMVPALLNALAIAENEVVGPTELEIRGLREFFGPYAEPHFEVWELRSGGIFHHMIMWHSGPLTREHADQVGAYRLELADAEDQRARAAGGSLSPGLFIVIVPSV